MALLKIFDISRLELLFCKVMSMYIECKIFIIYVFSFPCSSLTIEDVAYSPVSLSLIALMHIRDVYFNLTANLLASFPCNLTHK